MRRTPQGAAAGERTRARGLLPVVARRIAFVDKKSGGPLRLARADIRAFHKRPHHPLGGYRVLGDELAICGHHAAEVLNPGTVHIAVHQDTPDFAVPQFLRDGWEVQQGIDLSFSEEPHGLGPRMRDPFDVLSRIDRVEDPGDVVARFERHLHQQAVHVSILVRASDRRQERLGWRARGQSDSVRPDPGLFRGPFLRRDVGL